MVFFVQNQPPHQIFKGREVAWTLKNELRKQQSDFLIFRALEINTVSKYESLWHGLCRDCPIELSRPISASRTSRSVDLAGFGPQRVS